MKNPMLLHKGVTGVSKYKTESLSQHFNIILLCSMQAITTKLCCRVEKGIKTIRIISDN